MIIYYDLSVKENLSSFQTVFDNVVFIFNSVSYSCISNEHKLLRIEKRIRNVIIEIMLSYFNLLILLNHRFDRNVPITFYR